MNLSPSMRREWIEIMPDLQKTIPAMSPSMRREWIEMKLLSIIRTSSTCLPPCGGSGLKCHKILRIINDDGSPSMRREWIEIFDNIVNKIKEIVSLHAEGVD